MPLIESKEPDYAKASSAAHTIEDWIFAHQRSIWVVSAIGGLLIIAGMVAYFSGFQPGNRGATPSPVAVVEEQEPAEKADPSKWDSNFDSFSEAVRQAIAADQNLEEIFGSEPIRWEVTFKALIEGSDLFFHEADKLLDDNHGISIRGVLLPNERKKAMELRRGTKIILTGKIGTITSARTALHPQGSTTITIAECEISLPEQNQP